ncbi:MAG TPA: metalloregulator ArsR/SmtB family transcription factor [Candidatus Nanoarchaeia archaeon]|nr:metalloregulator ArsR/SmtB family transcription factor [Candidatus Nanoarchaeia archaeon]
MKSVKTISNPEAFKILADESRRKIIYLLRAKEMTVSQIADELDLTPQTVYHHIKKLVGADMVEVTREVRVDHLIESYYQATAEVFHLTVGNMIANKENISENIEASLQGLKKIGFNIVYDKEDVNRLAELWMQLDDCCSAKQYEDSIEKLDADYFVKHDIIEYAGLLAMTEEQLKQQDRIKSNITELIRSLLKSQSTNQ